MNIVIEDLGWKNDFTLYFVFSSNFMLFMCTDDFYFWFGDGRPTLIFNLDYTIKIQS